MCYHDMLSKTLNWTMQKLNQQVRVIRLGLNLNECPIHIEAAV